MDTTGPKKCVLIREVSLFFQRLICSVLLAGTSETVLIRVSEVKESLDIIIRQMTTERH